MSIFTYTKCPECGLKWSMPHVDERVTDLGSRLKFRPSNQVRCVECKVVFVPKAIKIACDEE